MMKENNDKNINKLEELEAKFEENPENFEIAKQLADIYIKLNQPEDAIVYLSKTLELNPDVRGYNQIGVCYLAQNRLDEAEKNLIKALKLDFNSIEAHFNLAFLCKKRGEYGRSLSHFKEVVLRDPEDYTAYYHMAECSFAVFMNEEAEIFLKEAIILKPDFLEAASNLSTFYIKRGRLSDAEITLSNILKYHPEAVGLHFSLGLVLKEQEKYLEAITHLRKVVILDENNAEAFNYLGECCIAAEMEEQAEPFFAKAIKLQPEYYQAIFNLGELYWEQGRKDEAIMTFEQCLAVLDKLAERKEKWGEEIDEEMYTPVYNFLGQIYMLYGKKNKAKEMWNKSLEINPEQPEIQKNLEKIPKPLHKRVSLTID